ncbi:SBBP repeat-containing protein [Leptolyngbya sp. FACHB-541]|uniref:SBBP repeat-containing protein n=1 Tax=Leptolyngbya sp. FACHB-541 TaxID=2692810 RepID=UPI001688D942|nr:SBBP repeat-containing protein [Leptolyngbya sp. FACHB-541]MBD2001373.1 SBBP repeat-containing protein [Leptolyngbya sp. FACHB-541]
MSDLVGRSDPNDFYRVKLSGKSSLDLKLSGLTANANLELRNSAGRILKASRLRGTNNEAVSFNVAAGTYFVRVYQQSGNTRYALDMSANLDAAGDTPARARNITLGRAATRYRDYVNGADNDFYSFRLNQRKEVSLTLTGLTGNATLQLRDRTGTTLKTSRQRGTTAESIREILNPGTYQIRVFADTKVVNSQYTLRTSAIPRSSSTRLSQQWLKQLGAANVNSNDYSYDVAANGNSVYQVGSTEGSLQSGSNNAGKQDGYVSRYDSSGTLQWTRQIGTDESDVLSGVAIGRTGSAYVAGAVDLEAPSLSRLFLGSGKAYIARYNTDGSQAWQREFARGNIAAASGIALDRADNAYLAGGFVNIGFSANLGAFVVKYDANGNAQNWAPSADINNITNSGVVSGITVDQTGNIYVTGITNASIDTSNLDPNNLNFNNLDTALTGEDAFVAKYDSTGRRLWFNTLRTNSDDYSRGITIDRTGNVYITGETAGVLPSGSLPTNTSTGGADAFVAKYNSNGAFQWTKQFGTTGNDQSQGVAVDSLGDVYLAGETFRTSGGSDSHALVAKYDSTGRLLLQQRIGTAQDDEAFGITVDSSDNVYISGQTFGDLAGADSNKGKYDAWIAKYQP